MEVGLFLTKVWALYFVLISLAFLINKKGLKKLMSIAMDDGFLMMSGVVSLLIGVLHVVAYNVWEPDVRGLITLFGWMALAKGISRLAWPEHSKKMIKSMSKGGSMQVWLVVALAIGLYLGYIAWF